MLSFANRRRPECAGAGRAVEACGGKSEPQPEGLAVVKLEGPIRYREGPELSVQMSFDARLTVTVIATICVIAAIAVVLPARIFVERSFPEEDATVLLLSHVAKQRLQEAVAKAGRGPSPAERAKLRHVMMPIANHLATRLDTFEP